MSKKGPAGAASLIKLTIGAGKATPTPPIGPALGQKGVKAMDFCKQFNDRTKSFVPGTPVPTRISVKPDRTFTFTTGVPTTTYLIMKAAGITKGGATTMDSPVGTISLKHVYEIARIKQRDEKMKNTTLRGMCGAVIGSCRTMGVTVVP